MKTIFCLNGKIVPKDRAVVYSQDPGFLYGFGIFETVLIHKHNPVFLKAHIQRLKDNARILGLHIDRDISRHINLLLKKSHFNSARMRINAWKGLKRDNILISLSSFRPYAESKYCKGFKVIISTFKINQSSVISRIKSMNYLVNFLARRQAEEKGADEAFLLNTKGFLVEGSRSNVFLVKQGKLITPAFSSGCLPGITRKVVINIANRCGMDVIEKDVLSGDSFKAEEVFITSSLMGIMPVTSLNRRKINKAEPGPVYKLLADKYRLKALG